MRSLRARRDTSGLRRDPAPSRWGYRWHRMMLSPIYRRLVRIGIPLALIAVIGTVWFSRETNRDTLGMKYSTFVDSLQNRPEFLVSSIAVVGVDEALDQQIRTVLPVALPMSSFDLDLDAMRGTVEAINAVEKAVLRVKPGGVLEVDVTPREAVAVWRAEDGLRLIDMNGVFVAPLESRADRLDLPLIAGDGAKDSIAEALRIYAAAGPVAPRVRGLVRMGERRWDVVLDHDQRVMLPAQSPVQAFQRVIVMAESQDLLARDVAVVDVRSEARPTIRMNENAAVTMRQINASVAGTGH